MPGGKSRDAPTHGRRPSRRRSQKRRANLTTTVVFSLLAVTSTALAAEEPAPTTTTTQPETTTTAEPAPTTTTEPEAAPTAEPEAPPPAGEDTDVDSGQLPEGEVVMQVPSLLVFPVQGVNSFGDSFGAPRDGGRRQHKGVDIFAEKGTPVVAVVDGTIWTMSDGERSGQFITLMHDDDWRSMYMHLNNDTPGTDDGRGVGFAEGIAKGMRVTAGTVIGFVGDSGNAEGTPPHLHFELRTPDGTSIDPYEALRNAGTAGPSSGEAATAQALALTATTTETGSPQSVPQPETHNTVLVGYLDPDPTGFSADIALHDGHVYMGTWGRPERCPGTGVRVIDVSDPTSPTKVASLATGEEFPGTRSESIWVGEVDIPSFRGTVGVAGVRLCDSGWQERGGGLFVGLAVYDLTDPTSPVLLSTIHSGEQTQGVHQVTVRVDDDRLLAAATVPQSHLHNPDGMGDVRFYDLTDVDAPVALSDWDLRRDGPGDVVADLIATVGQEALSGHTVGWLDADRVVVAHSAGGLITLDVSDPARPTYISAATPHPMEQLASSHEFGRGHGHNAHSGWLYDETVLVQDDQNLLPIAGEDGQPGAWGGQIFYDYTDPENPRSVGTFATENTVEGEDGIVAQDGYYTAHQSAPYGARSELVTWFSDGVRIVDLTDPENPAEIAYFVPPPRKDPQGWWIAPDGTAELPMVWGAVSDGELVYASDINSGLWVFEVVTGDANAATQSPS